MHDFSNKKENNQNVLKGKQTHRKNVTSDFENKTSKSSGKLQYNNDTLFKSSYDLFYSKKKVEENKSKKSQKKLITNSLDFFSSHNNITGNVQKIQEDKKFPNGKKLFTTVYHKKSLVNMYRGDLNIQTKYEPVQPEILHAFSTKKHFVNFYLKNLIFI